MTLERVRQLAESNNGDLPAYTDIGLYPIAYFDYDNEALCAKCATEALNDPDEIERYRPHDYYINWETTTLDCCKCGEHLSSAYGDD